MIVWSKNKTFDEQNIYLLKEQWYEKNCSTFAYQKWLRKFSC